jgi:hypothetical protein
VSGKPIGAGAGSKANPTNVTMLEAARELTSSLKQGNPCLTHLESAYASEFAYACAHGRARLFIFAHACGMETEIDHMQYDE